MKNWIYLALITISMLVLAPSLVAKAFAFTLDVTVTHKPFGDNGAYINVKGPDGYTTSHWYDWADIKTGGKSGEVTLSLPNDAFPIGDTYQVCVSSKQIMSLLPFCHSFNHENEHESVTVSLS